MEKHACDSKYSDIASSAHESSCIALLASRPQRNSLVLLS